MLEVPLLLEPEDTDSPEARARVRAIHEADLASFRTQVGLKDGPSGQPSQGLKKLRDTHHALARLVAVGVSNIEASAVTGYDPGYISVLKKDPAFIELIAHYRANLDVARADITERLTALTGGFLSELQDRLEYSADGMSNSFVLETVKTLLDRTGHAPVARNVNVNIDLASRLEAARRRIGRIGPGPQAPQIDGVEEMEIGS